MKPFIADLHTHTTFSDGTDTPQELLKRAKSLKVDAISITDHDTIDAYSEETNKVAKELEMTLIRGVEISSELQGSSVHILG